MTVQDYLKELEAEVVNGKVKLNRFNKKKFTGLMCALANDTEFVTKVAKSVEKGTKCEVEEVLVGKEFRKWLKKILEQAGIDKMESERVMDPAAFEIGNMDVFYDFFCTAVTEYMSAGNYFVMQTTPDLEATLYIHDVDEKVVEKEAFTPGKLEDRKSLGKYRTNYGKHKEVGVKSSCPSWLKDRKKL